MAKILITGGAGFVGYHLAKKLSEKDNEIVLADRFSLEKKDQDLETLLKKPNVKAIQIDLTDKKSWEKIGGGYDYVYHLASISRFKLFSEIPNEVLRMGLLSTINLLEWFRKENNKPKAKILYTSSNEVYMGLPGYMDIPIPTPEKIPLIIADTYNPRWSYAGQKIINELLFINNAKTYGLRVVIVRPQNIYGPRAGYSSMIPKFINLSLTHTDTFPLISPDENRSSCFIDDVISAMQAVIESPKTDNQTYNIGTSYETTVKDITEKIFSITNWHPKKFDIKKSPNDAKKHSIADVSKIKRDTGWEAKTTLEQGLRKTIEWYTKNPKK